MKLGLTSSAALAASLMAVLMVAACTDEPIEAAATEPTRDIRFGRDIRPLLSDRCFQCHGVDPASREAGLRLDLREEAVASHDGVRAIVPGDLDSSELWARITSDDPDVVMPPPSAKKRPLTAEDRAALAAWIERGAPYEEHWSFVAPRRPEAPRVEKSDWVRDPLDAHVLARMERAGFEPVDEADAATLVRRLFLDITGLPPTVAELDQLVALLEVGGDAAYAKLVTQLFEEEPWRSRMAEHLASRWLDAARYADTCGIHTDNGRQMWLWRDGLLKALRDNQPFDQFVTEQLAGDLIPGATAAQRIASGFNRNHVTTDEGGAIPEEYLVEYAVDRANTTSAVFLGLTAGCARCHDHKFDPMTQEDYFSLLAFFNSIDEPGLYSQTKDSQRAYEPFEDFPTASHQKELDEIGRRLGALDEELAQPVPEQARKIRDFVAGVAQRLGSSWSRPTVLSARSTDDGVTLERQQDESFLAKGPHPDFEDYEFVFRPGATDARLLLLEALSGPNGPGAGRAGHGNAVISRLTLEARSSEGDDASWREVPLIWAWSDHLQRNYDHEPPRMLEDDHSLGWAADGNAGAGPRALLILSAAPMNRAGEDVLRLRIAFRSPYAKHSLARVRFALSPLGATEDLDSSAGRFWRIGPFASDADAEGMKAIEAGLVVERGKRFGAARRQWSFDGRFDGGDDVDLGRDAGTIYLSRSIWSPDARTREVTLSSTVRTTVFTRGRRVDSWDPSAGDAGKRTVVLRLEPGRNLVLVKLENAAGVLSRLGWNGKDTPSTLEGELGSAALPPEAVTDEQEQDFTLAWRRHRSTDYRAKDDLRAELIEQREAKKKTVPRSMVMAELGEPRQTYVLDRGQYDHPNKERPVERRAPSFLPSLPESAPKNRLGLAQWLVAEENPLFARVAVNRLWEQIFGKGLVRTGEDFGLQGQWPTHPELLDELAVDFRESGWDVHGMLRRFLTSATYRQASVRPREVAERDPENELLVGYPRRRLSGEQVRDLALYVSGLLVERFGGPSVKTYQPAGLWKEVAMLSSNTRHFVRGEGEDLWRRSLYTYWKRAVPPPFLATFDAPTREACVLSRQETRSPLQSLAMWNDEQMVEASRKLAERALLTNEDDELRLEWLVRTSTGRRPLSEELTRYSATLAELRREYRDAPEEAEKLVRVGEAPRDAKFDDPEALAELAAWTLIANAVLSLHETITQD